MAGNNHETKITLPKLGESVFEGTILRWLKKEGESIKKDELLFEISTDKIDTEIPSSAEGIVKEILIPEGQKVPVDTAIAIIGEDGEARAGKPAEVPPAKPDMAAAPSETAAKPKPEQHAPSGDGVVISPAVKKLAREKHIDLSQIKGTGASGRVTRNDVLSYLEAAGKEKAAEAPARPEAPAVPPVQAAAPSAAQPQAATLQAGEQKVPLTMIRKQIAEHMINSWHTSPHVTSVIEIDMEAIVQYRESIKTKFKAQEGFSLTYLPFIAKACIENLLEFPNLNASMAENDQVIIRSFVNLSIAVDIPDGLIVPVIFHAEEKNMLGLARGIHDIATRAKEKKLKPDEVHGGTFTITNPGVFGTMITTPIINQPQAGILSTDVVEPRVVPWNGGIAVRHRGFMSLSFDHRIADGAYAARFLASLKQKLESFSMQDDIWS